MAAPRREQRPVDYNTEVGLLAQMQGMSDEEAAQIVLNHRVAEARRALERADAIARSEQVLVERGFHPKAARALAATQAEMAPQMAPQAAPHARPQIAPGVESTTASVYATPYQMPRQEYNGAYPLGQDPLTRNLRDERLYWNEGERAAIPSRTQAEVDDEDFAAAYNRQRGMI